VLKGDMALVGPRPEVEEFVAAQAEPYERILTVPPGLTGPTQLEFADEGKLLAATPDPVRTYLDEVLPLKVYLDLQYVESNNLRGDMATLARTLILPVRKTAERVAFGFEERAQSRWERAQLLLASVGALVLTIAFAAQGASGI
jgi:lipopolysaccharide/colanic/teichoic acid biosynthesis glycosyltransferase